MQLVLLRGGQLSFEAFSAALKKEAAEKADIAKNGKGFASDWAKKSAPAARLSDGGKVALAPGGVSDWLHGKYCELVF
jgi:hypothetical protein